MLVKGRHLGNAKFDSSKIESNFVVHEDGVTLRLDDANNLEWWLEVDITKEQLEQLLKQMK